MDSSIKVIQPSELVKQSPPINIKDPYDAAWVSGKTILITGGASGFGEGFFRKWAENGASVIIGDINATKGKALVEEVRQKTGSKNHHYLHCNVTDWQSQVDFFHDAIKLSPTRGIDAVVANAGITEPPMSFQTPKNLDADEPPPPDFKCFNVNLLGVMYTAHLALFYLPRNPNSRAPDPSYAPGPNIPDRHLLFVGSVASIMPLPGQVQYCTSKHGVLGLFRSLRSTISLNGIRVNAVLPYFIDTPLIPVGGRLLLAGGGLGKPEDVVDAATRLMADSRIIGRALCIGPEARVNDECELVTDPSKDGHVTAVWEAYADDFGQVESFVRRFLIMINTIEKVKGWVGLGSDILKAFLYPIRKLTGAKST